MIYSDILSSIKTVDEAKELSLEIDTLMSNIFRTESQNLEQSLKSINVNTANSLKTILANINDKDKINGILSDLKVNLKNFKVLKLTIAFESSENLINNLYSWVLKNLREGIILDINTDKSIIGGAIIEFEGKYKDFSLKEKLEETFANKREEILKLYENSKF